jgi:hypothetical protein
VGSEQLLAVGSGQNVVGSGLWAIPGKYGGVKPDINFKFRVFLTLHHLLRACSYLYHLYQLYQFFNPANKSTRQLYQLYKLYKLFDPANSSTFNLSTC